MRILAALLVVAGCAAPASEGLLELAGISPSSGSVDGGTRVSLRGGGFQPGVTVRIGNEPCEPLELVSAGSLTCLTGSNGLVEGAVDVVLTNPDGQSAMLPRGYGYRCTWQTRTGRESCGARPPRTVAEQEIAGWVDEIEDGHGWVANASEPPAAEDLDDTTDHVIGEHAIWVRTDGAGTARTLTRLGLPAIDMRDRMPKLWLKVEGIHHVRALELDVGNDELASYARFRLQSTQGQPWITNGDWVQLALPWAPDAVVGTPRREAITDLRVRVIDDGRDWPVTVHLDAIALVAERAAPRGIVSFTFDDNYPSQRSVAAPLLARYGFAATSYVIVEAVDEPGKLAESDLRALQDEHGWEIAAHAYRADHHRAGFPGLDEEVLEDDLVDTRAWLMERGFTGYDHLSYPSGEFTGARGTDVLGLVRDYFATARTIYTRQQEAWPASDPHKLRVIHVARDTPLAAVEAALDRVVATRSWGILVFHELADTPERTTQWRVADFEAVIRRVHALGLPVRTIGEASAIEPLHPVEPAP